MRRFVSLGSAALLAALVVAVDGTTARALTRTTVHLDFANPGTYSMVDRGTSTTFGGTITPAHPTGTKVRLQRYTGGAWHTVQTTTALHGAVYHFTTPKLTSYGFFKYRTCVSATPRFGSDCSPGRNVVVGRTRYLADMTPNAVTGGFSTGTLVVGELVRKHALRWSDSTASGSVTYDLGGKCVYGFLGIGVDDSAGDIGNVTFSLLLDGTRVARATVGNGPYYDWNKLIKGVRTVTLTATSTLPENANGGWFGFGEVNAFCAS
ncbi:MAG: hypothetical protein JWM93_1932 [Frankiales bacterium]|nr:hypothetical protein [Frankiales bacterium]